MSALQVRSHQTNSLSLRKKSPWTKIKESRYFYLFFALPFLYFVLFKYGAMFYLGIAFQDYNAFKGIFGSEFVGLKHFAEFISDPYFWSILKDTIVLNLWMLVFYFPCPIILALLINDVKSKRFQKFTQSVTYLPYFLSTVVVCGFITNILASDGLINQIIVALGGEKTTLLMNPYAFRPIYVLSEIWQQVGWGSIIYLAALTGIDSQLYEAASIDGASKWRQLWSISLPGISPVTAAVVRIFLSAHKVEQQGYKSCMALLKLADRYSPQRLESACRKALSYTSSPSLKSVQSILKSGQDKLLPEDAPAKQEEPKAHKFTRGAGYYKRGE